MHALTELAPGQMPLKGIRSLFINTKIEGSIFQRLKNRLDECLVSMKRHRSADGRHMLMIRTAASPDNSQMGQHRLQHGILPAQIDRVARHPSSSAASSSALTFGARHWLVRREFAQPHGSPTAKFLREMRWMGAIDHVIRRAVACGPVHGGDRPSQVLSRGQTAIGFNRESDDYRHGHGLGGAGNADGFLGIVSA